MGKNIKTVSDLPFVYFYFMLYFTTAQQGDMTVKDLIEIKKIQDMFCIPENTCSNQSSFPGIPPIIPPETPLPQSQETITPESPITHFLPVLPPLKRSSTCCGKCSCKADNCDVSNSCCVEALEELPPITDSKVGMSCNRQQLRPYNFRYPNSDYSVLTLRECPRGSKLDFEIVDKCENSDNYSDIESKLPVTDNTTMYNYKNRFCAFCHNVTESTLHDWEISLECLHGNLKPRNISSLVTEVLQSEGCNLIFSRPTSLGTKGPVYTCRLAISECNVTGYWKTYNSLIEAACLAYSTIYNFKYRNVFCYMCNTNDFIGLYYCTEKPEPSIFVSFKALLRIKPGPSVSAFERIETACFKNQIYDPLKKQCRDIECLFPKTLEDGICIDFVEYLAGIEYGIYLRMTPSREIEADNILRFRSMAIELRNEIILLFNNTIQNDCKKSFSVYSNLYPVTDVHQHIIINKLSYFVVYVELSCSIRNPVSPDIVDKMLSYHGTTFITRNLLFNGSVTEFKVEVDMYHENNSTITNNQFDKHINYLFPLISDIVSTDAPGYPLTVLSVPYACPSVRINSDEFNIVRSMESIFIEEYNVTIESNELLIEKMPDGNGISVRMCTSLFESFVQPFIITLPDKPTVLHIQSACGAEVFSAVTILTFVCTAISICFSFITLLVYLKFKKYTTQPGVNNMVLCAALIVAQSLYQFGSGQSCNVSKLSCQVIGLFVHFSWLFLMFWMNSCCIHMFRVFKINKTKMAIFNVAKTTMVYVVYSFLGSASLVITNVIVSLVDSDGNDIGYGGSLCYISQGQRVAYLFALPVAVIVVLNIILFTTVLLQMRNTSKVQDDTKRLQFLHIYTKLSTLTGITWVLGFCSYFLNIAVLDYIFIILNASQGLFLFLAFVANRRTLKSVWLGKGNEQSVNKTPFSNIGGVTDSSTLSK